ncbi:hypothetical protein DFJ58DRAFT_786851 [Suillus subalutaceus]|uniref:uncharacterized protein n=1 Tax=Suillus subalutaceus TaxID=48586 RepID=UPI001B86DFEE|nr:uncharacterized protein DFJ58DRAFT_786851 [Suillus subalutaceus]KAG1854946.1 hypothetical protein DFJ58DRAFT_786851 [Suillus subalutaceus]
MHRLSLLLNVRSRPTRQLQVVLPVPFVLPTLRSCHHPISIASSMCEAAELLATMLGDFVPKRSINGIPEDGSNFSVWYGKSPKVDRAVARHSAAPVSDGSGFENECVGPLMPSQGKASHMVSEPKFKPAAKSRSQTAVSMATIDEFLKQKGELDQQRFEAQQEWFAREVN